MDKKLLGIEDYWDKLLHKTMTADGILYDYPFFLFAAYISNTSAAGARGVFHAGINTSAPMLFQLAEGSYGIAGMNFWPPLYLHKGLYVDFTGTINSMLFHYLPLKNIQK